MKKITLLSNHRFQFFSIDEIISWILGKGFGFFAFFDERTLVDEDFIVIRIMYLFDREFQGDVGGFLL